MDKRIKIKYHGIAVMSQGQMTACIIYLNGMIYYVTTDAREMTIERSRIRKWTETKQVAGTW